MIKVGLTGGIGSGKSTVARLFEAKGIPVYNSDEKAKFLMQNDKHIQKKLIEKFGPEVFVNKSLNTKYLASLVFNDKNRLKELENIVHPAVRQDFTEWTTKQEAPYVIVENAILHKSGMDQLVDYIITVVSDKEKRIERVINRDKLDKKEIEKRINSQDSIGYITKNADFIINNNKNIDYLTEKVDFVDKKLKKLLKKS